MITRTKSNATFWGRFILLFAMIGLFFVLGGDRNGVAVAQTQSSGAEYQAPGCTFSVQFPRKPRIKIMSRPTSSGDFRYEQAEFQGEVDYLRVECLGVVITREVAIDALKKQIEADGLQNAGLELGRSDYVEARGYKKISGANATYVLRTYFGIGSTLFLMAATKSEAYPTDNVFAFFESVKTAPAR